jgi:hypothetical protein
MPPAESRKQADLLIKQKGLLLYQTFTEQERLIVRFGLFPGEKMSTAHRELMALNLETYDESDISRLLAVAVMDAANAGPGKLVV